jgi:UDP-2-acetamido-2-deoxy-ribo-hexuluronate aminotransferase
LTFGHKFAKNRGARFKAMDLLIDVNIVLDVCANRMPFAPISAAALQHCKDQGAKLWLYAGSVQTMEFNMVREVIRKAEGQDTQINKRQCAALARRALKVFAQDKHWLASLAGEGNVFDSQDPEDEQLVRALSRFATGSIKLLTRDGKLCERYPQHTITPQQYLQSLQQSAPLSFIDLAGQQDNLRPQLERNIHRVLHHGQYIMGPEVAELEGKLARYTGAQHCITVASGTEALLIALMALDVKPGDEIITTPFTFVATAEVIALLGATPVFVDIEPDTCNIDASKIEVAITPRTRAIMPVSLYGQPADMDEINAIAARHGLTVIEDAAQSFGAEYKGHKSCNLSTIGCTSFFPSKPLGCYGDGGAIFTSDDKLAKAMREIRVHGQERRYVHTRIGVGGRMDTLQCAVVLGKLERFEWEVEQRLRIGARYNELFAGKVPTVTQRPDRTSVFAQYTVFVENREQVQEKLKTAGVPTAVHYPIPLNRQSAYQALSRISNNVSSSDAMAGRVMSLPMSADLSQHEQDQIFMLVIKALGK